MSAGVCSVLKSRPRRVRRSVSNNSVDVHGAVTVKKIWLEEGDTLVTDHLLESHDFDCIGPRKRHVWSLYTNLSCTQQCAKCQKRILTRRAAYKCTACKKLCHLKCAYSESSVSSRTRSKTKFGEKKQNWIETKQSDGNVLQHGEETRLKKPEYSCGDKENGAFGESDSLAEFIMEENKCKADSPTSAKGYNTTPQGQAKQTLGKMRTNFVRRCKSIKKKVEKLRDKLNCEDHHKNEDEATQEVPTGTDCGYEDFTSGARDAWLNSPIRKRLRCKLQDEIDDDRIESRVDRLAYKRVTRKRRCHAYEFELSHMSDRLDAVEKKIQDLEQSIPEEVEEWRKLHKKFLMSDGYSCHPLDSEDPQVMIHETTPKVPLQDDNIPSSISVATSDEACVAPESRVSCHMGVCSQTNDGPLLTDTSEKEEPVPSAVPPRLKIDGQWETSEEWSQHQQTSTPVTNKEISFRSATKKYQLSQVTHTNYTHIKMDTSGIESCTTNRDNVDANMNMADNKSDPNTSNEHKILSPNQLAVKSFLDRRRKSGNEFNNMDPEAKPKLSAEEKVLSPNQLAVQQFLQRRRSNPCNSRLSDQRPVSEEVEGIVCSSPPIASSTFTNGNGDTHNPPFNMSPIPFTCRNGFDSSGVSSSKISEELKGNGRKSSGLERHALNMSALSYTFRNDSSMIHTDANENLPGFSDNLPRKRQDNNDSPRQQIEILQSKASERFSGRPQTPMASASDGQSLTNVTEITLEFPNSFADKREANTESHVEKANMASTNTKRFSDEFLQQIKSGVKLKDTSLESNDLMEEMSVDKASGDSELKLVYDRIVKHDRQSKKNSADHATVCLRNVVIDETGDNGQNKFRKRKYPIYGPRYQELFRLSNSEKTDWIANTCQESMDSWEQKKCTDMIQKLGPPLPPKPKRTSEISEQNYGNCIHGECVRKEQDLNPDDYKKDISLDRRAGFDATEEMKKATGKEEEAVLEATQEERKVVVDATGDIVATTDILKPVGDTDELIFAMKNNRNETKSETFPRTSKKHYNCSHLGYDGTYEKAASYAGSLDHDRRSVYTETGSLDRYGDAKYHFLHEKGMIKISSPRLELVSETPSKRILQSKDNPNSHISEEGTETCDTKSDMSGVIIDNELHLAEFRKRLEEFDDTLDDHNQIIGKDDIAKPLPMLEDFGKEKPDKCQQISESLNSEIQSRQQDLANDILENCLEMIDNNQAALDHVFDWINKDYDNSDNSAKDELDAIICEENNVDEENGFLCPVDESVYYSFMGQSEEIRNVANHGETDQHVLTEDKIMKDFSVAVRNGDHAAVSEFLKSDIIIPNASLKDALDFAVKQRNRPLTKELLDYACRSLSHIEMTDNDIIEVWPAYQMENDWSPVFVMLTETECETEWSEFLGYKVYSRQYSAVNTEASIVLNSDIVNNNPLSFISFERLKLAVDQVDLLEHSNITAINLCPCRSRKQGEEIVVEPCVVIHCLVKGLIPFNEKPFPKSLIGIPVDIREAYFTQGVLKAAQLKAWENLESCIEYSDTNDSGSTNGEDALAESSHLETGSEDNLHEADDGGPDQGESAQADDLADVEMDYHPNPKDLDGHVTIQGEPAYASTEDDNYKKLKMGAFISGADGSRMGTLGGFIPLADGQMGFLTCAHVVGQEIGRPVSVIGTTDGSQDSQRRVCGYVSQAVSQSGSGSRTGVDAAVVTITSGQPDCPEFVSVNRKQLELTGMNHPPRFYLGRFLTLEEVGQRWSARVTKVGASTGLTVGRLYSYGTFVRQLNHEQNLDTDRQRAGFFNQLEIVTDSGSARFFDLGDSGALVFMPLNDQDWYCVGLAVGCSSYGSCIVTPIEHVFESLQLPAKFYCCSEIVE